MKKEFWIEKWQNKQTGFHKEFVHPLLVKYIDYLQIKKGDTIFVPLCGKTLDMLWLHEQGYQVIGVELSDLAIEQFFAENKLQAEIFQEADFKIFKHKNITIYQGDFFALTDKHLKKVKALYDRAALIALPDGLIERYVNKNFATLPQGTKELLITLELQRTTTDKLGPPFSVSDKKVSHLFSQYSSIQLLQEEDIIEREKGFQQLGCEYCYERVYLINY